MWTTPEEEQVLLTKLSMPQFHSVHGMCPCMSLEGHVGP